MRISNKVEVLVRKGLRIRNEHMISLPIVIIEY